MRFVIVDGRYTGKHFASRRPTSRAVCDSNTTSVSVAPLAPQLIQNVVGRATAGLSGGDGRHGGRVPAFDLGECRLEVQPAERSAQRALPLVLVPCRECDRQECGEQGAGATPTTEMPVPAGEDRDQGLGQEDDGGSHREEDGVAPIEEELDEPDRCERVQRHGDDGQDIKDTGPLPGWGRSV